MELAGYIISLLIGIALGLFGGGGSILTVPVLVYLFRIQPVVATAYSLFIVGSTSLVGSYPKYKRGEVDLKTAAIFGTSSVAIVYITRAFVLPAIPEHLFNISGLTFTKSMLIMLLFAALMIVAALSMIKRSSHAEDSEGKPATFNLSKILFQGVLVGFVTAVVGAGGGFLIIPALVILTGLPMKDAVGTSLVIIAANSLIGFIGDAGHSKMNWMFLLSITTLAVAGTFIGNILSRKVSGQHLKKAFGWFVLAMGVYIFVKELFFSAAVAY
ncbi:MAG: sulfite exporter TauE/SafE family protein [Agriterribacter sp.]